MPGELICSNNCVCSHRKLTLTVDSLPRKRFKITPGELVEKLEPKAIIKIEDPEVGCGFSGFTVKLTS